MRCDPEAVVEGLYAAWRIQDIDATLAYCADDIRYTVHQPEGITGIGGVMVGKKPLRAYLTAVCDTWEFTFVAPVTLVVEDDIFVHELTQFQVVHRRSGLPLDGTKRHVWRVEGGRVTACDEYQDAARIKAFMQMVESR